MSLTGSSTYVGFGFGAIQSGLFLYEAYQSGAFGRLVVAEIVPDVVDAVRRAEGYFTVNIAHAAHVENAHIGATAIENPDVDTDRQLLIDAIADAEEIGTAVPSVNYYVSDSAGSLHRVLAEGLRKKAAANKPRAVIYAAENHNRAAEILEEKVLAEIPEDERAAVKARVRFLNTVIGKMSGVITDPDEIRAANLVPVTPGDQRAFLVEAFNRILITRIDFPEPFRRGIAVFEEKTDLLPFEEAKLYGHNAMHGLAAYLGAVRGVKRISDLRDVPGVLTFMRAAMFDETGMALIRRYSGLDPLFTPEGFGAAVDDLLARMVNPYLRDTVERVGRDPARKLGWDDRLIGAIRLALKYDVEPRRYAVGAAAALATLTPATFSDVSIADTLDSLWSSASPDPDERKTVIDQIEAGRHRLKRWIKSGFTDLENLVTVT